MSKEEILDKKTFKAKIVDAREGNYEFNNIKIFNADLSGEIVNRSKQGINGIMMLDCSNLNLENISLCNCNLQYINFKDANLKNADLSGSNVKNAVFKGANIENVNFIGTNIAPIQLLYAVNLNKAQFSNKEKMIEDIAKYRSEVEKETNNDFKSKIFKLLSNILYNMLGDADTKAAQSNKNVKMSKLTNDLTSNVDNKISIAPQVVPTPTKYIEIVSKGRSNNSSKDKQQI
ncbi:MAG: pentapeptide repeat-containing protein [Alphaproteobacteria bacterium]